MGTDDFGLSCDTEGRMEVNRKAVYHALRIKPWLVHQPTYTPRPRAQALRGRALKSNDRWAMDVTHTPCGCDG